MANGISNKLRLTSVIASLQSGGIGTVCPDAALGIALGNDWEVTVLSLHDDAGEWMDETGRMRTVCLGLDGNCPRQFLAWQAANPQDLVVTSDVSRIEPAFRFLPATTRHVIQIHDSGRRYRGVAVRNAPWVDGVTCVGRHIEGPLRRSLEGSGFRGLLRTVHNGAHFPPPKDRQPHSGPLRLLFMGQIDAFKGVFDVIPILRRLRRWKVPVTLTLVGGENETLRRKLERVGLAEAVHWAGRVPHQKCYDIAAVSDVFMMTSRKESFGMVTIEAMSMGCVPIAYDIPSGSTEIIENGRSGLLVGLGDFAAYAQYIRELHEDRSRLAALATGAAARARSHFSAKVMSVNLADFLRDVLEHSASYPARRESGLPPEEPVVYVRPRRGYQVLPPAFRERIRHAIGARPRLCHWLLGR